MSLDKVLEPRYNVNVKPDGWVLPNRAKYVTWLDKTFKYGRVQQKQKCTSCEEGEECDLPTAIDLFPHQKFVKDYMQFASPYRGILLYHGLGSGKTLSSIAAAEILMNHMDVMVMLPASLRANYVNEIRKYGRKYYQLNQKWHKEVKPSEQQLHKLKISSKLASRHKGIWIPVANGKQFSSLSQDEQKQITDQTADVIQNRFNFINFDGLRRESIKKLAESGNPFDNKCVIIDEVHNLISRIRNEGITGKPIYNLIMKAKNCKLILLSGTPVINYPCEVAYLINMLIGFRVLYKCDVSKGNINELEAIIKKFRYVDFFDINIQKKTLQFTILPDGFKWKSRTELEVSRSTSESILTKLVDFLKEYGYIISEPQILSAVKKPKKEIEKYYKALPEEDDAFNALFVDQEKGEFKNKELFMKRILGTVSYYNNVSRDLFPSVEISEVALPMPPYMFSEYQKWRMIERDKEKFAKPTGNIFDSSGQVYRFYSRAICNFVFPSTIKRLFPSDLRKIKNEVDDVDHVIEKSKGVVDAAETDIDKKYIKERDEAISKLKKSEYLDLDKIKELSPKYYEIISAIDSLDGTALVYSQFRNVEGLGLLCAAMDANGYEEFKIAKIPDTNEWKIQNLDSGKPKYFQFRSDREETQILMRIFNNDFEHVPTSIQKQLAGGHDNLRGDLIKVIMITQSGSEGISLKNVRQVHIIEPFWNHVRLDQVIGRAVRTCSHVALPVEDRNVRVFIYYMTFTNKQLEESFTIRVKDKSMTSDQYLYDLAKRKKAIIDTMLECMQKASVDCGLNAKVHGNLRCFSFPVNVKDDTFTFKFEMNKETFDNEYVKEIEQKEWKGRVLVTKRGQFLIKPETNEVYDYELYLSANRLVKLGLLAEENGQKIIKMSSSEAASATSSAASSPEAAAASSTAKSKRRSSSDESSAKRRSNSEESSAKQSVSSAEESSAAETPADIKLGTLTWHSNSCYIDSLLVALAHVPNPIVDILLESLPRYSGKNKLTLEKHALAIKAEMKAIVKNIQSGEKNACSNLRSLFMKFDKQYMKQIDENQEEIDWIKDQQEPLDVLRLLDRALTLKNNTKVRISDNEPQEVSFFSPTITVVDDTDDIYVKDQIPLYQDKIVNDKGVERKVRTEYLESTGMFIVVNRFYSEYNVKAGEYINKKKKFGAVIPTESVKGLKLVSIVVHHGTSIEHGHYTCYVKHDEDWYHFDDMKGNYVKVANIPKTVYKNSVGYVYV